MKTKFCLEHLDLAPESKILESTTDKSQNFMDVSTIHNWLAKTVVNKITTAFGFGAKGLNGLKFRQFYNIQIKSLNMYTLNDK